MIVRACSVMLRVSWISARHKFGVTVVDDPGAADRVLGGVIARIHRLLHDETYPRRAVRRRDRDGDHRTAPTRRRSWFGELAIVAEQIREGSPIWIIPAPYERNC